MNEIHLSIATRNELAGVCCFRTTRLPRRTLGEKGSTMGKNILMFILNEVKHFVWMSKTCCFRK